MKFEQEKKLSKPPLFSGSIARRLIAAFIVLGIFVTLITTAVQSYRDYQNEIQKIDLSFDNVRASHGRSLAASVWVLSEKQTEIELQGLLNIPGFEYAEIRTNDGEIWKAGQIVSTDVVVKETPLSFSKDGKEQVLGTLLVVAGKRGIYDRVRIRTFESLIYHGSWVFILAGSLFLIFRQQVTRHLNTLARYTSSISLDTNAKPLDLDRPASPGGRMDELDQVTNAINSMRSQLVETISELQRSETRFRDFAESSSDWFWEMDENLQSTYVSPSIKFTTGYDPDYFIGKRRDEYTSENTHNDKWRQHLDDMRNHRRFRDFSFELTKADGMTLPVSVNGSPQFDQDGNFRGYRGTGRDISEIVSLEEQFRRSQKMEAVGQLSGGIAHDFNNILGIVMGNLQILQRLVGKDDKALNRIDVALKGVQRGADLTRKLLGFSRQEAHGKELASINKFIENLGELLTRSLTVAIDVEHHLSPDLWLVEVDPGDLQDAILNLSLNARDAMPDGGRLVIETGNKILDEEYVRHNPQGKEGEFVMLSVSDSGHGMTAEVRERVFEPFFSTKEEGKGTGLGLSMVYGFVQRSGGHMNIYSEPEQGTTITLYLPRALRTGTENDSPAIENADLPGGAETILVVDDEDHLVDIATTHLEDLGYATLRASNGIDALEMLDNHPEIDLLFSDIIMPGDLDGYQLAIAAQKANPSLKALLTSGFTKKKEDYFSADGSRYAELAANLLNKPYNQAELASAIRNTLDGRDV